MIAEYWEDGPYSTQTPGHWLSLAQFISTRDNQTSDQDIVLYFTLSNALFDAGIAAWDAKRSFDSARPITLIPDIYSSRLIRSWGGPHKGSIQMSGEQWMPYQPASFPTPPFPDYVSGHSTFSAAAARILQLWTGSDRFGMSVTLQPGSSVIEPGDTPKKPIILAWKTFSDAADEAGMSRRYGGIHFESADVAGRKLGRLVSEQVWAKTQNLVQGRRTSTVAETAGR